MERTPAQWNSNKDIYCFQYQLPSKEKPPPKRQGVTLKMLRMDKTLFVHASNVENKVV